MHKAVPGAQQLFPMIDVLPAQLSLVSDPVDLPARRPLKHSYEEICPVHGKAGFARASSGVPARSHPSFPRLPSAAICLTAYARPFRGCVGHPLPHENVSYQTFRKVAQLVCPNRCLSD